MKSLRLVGLMLAISLMATPAVAGDLGVFFDTDGTVDNMIFQPMTPFKIHVVMYNMNDFAQGVEFKLDLPPELVVLEQTYAENSTVFPYLGQNLGALVGVQIGLGPCQYLGEGLNPTYRVMTMLVYSPVSVGSSSITLSGFPGPTGDVQPRYAQCPSMNLFQMTPTEGTFSVSVDADSPSWGSVKAQFGD